MSAIGKILAPVDFSDSAVRAACGAIAWAERFGAEVCLLHVVPDTLHDRAYHDLAEFSRPTLVEDWTRGTRDALDALAARMSSAPGRVRTLVRLGQPAAEIITCAAEQHTDLIIMASTGHGPVGRLLLGSVAEQVVRGAICPVLSIPGGADVTRWSEDREGVLRSMRLRTVVALTDLSEVSRDAVAYAHRLAADLHAALHVLHVVAPTQDMQLAYVPPPAQRTEELRWRAERAVMRVTEGFEDAGAIVTATRLGDALKEIVGYAVEVNADLMVMATHGRGGLERLILGSVAQSVLRHAPCPIVTINQAWRQASHARVSATSEEENAASERVAGSGAP